MTTRDRSYNSIYMKDVYMLQRVGRDQGLFNCL